jgi:transposase
VPEDAGGGTLGLSVQDGGAHPDALLTNAPDLTPVEAVQRYNSFADIERGFRVLKSDIEIAPVHHRPTASAPTR